MNPFSTKTVALTVAIALGTLMSSSAHAAILRTADGASVTTKDGSAVLVREYGVCDVGQQEGVVYFDFNKSGLTKKYKSELSELATKIRKSGDKVSVVGFSDRMGNVAYNEKLALNRAKSVRDYLVAKGVKSNMIEVRSLGDSLSTTDCSADMTRAEKISCLSADRRVEIEIK
ncbi:MAG: OmpA family protein [Bdellovibrionales bacterium]